MFSENQNLNSKLSQLNPKNFEITTAPADLRAGGGFALNGKSIRVLIGCNKGSRILLFQDSISNQWYAIPENGSATNATILERDFINRHTYPDNKTIPLRCNRLQLAYVYSESKRGDYADIKLVDFNNEVYTIHTIDAVTNYNYDAEYTYLVHMPSGNYTIYESGFTYSYRGGTLSGKAIVDMVYLRNRETNPILPFDEENGRTTTGFQEAFTSEITRQYGLNQEPVVPAPTTINTNIDALLWPLAGTLESNYAEVVFDPANSWSGSLSEGVDAYSQAHIPDFNVSTFKSFAGIEDSPWQLATFHVGSPNPQVTGLTSITIDGESYRRDFVQYGLAHWEWNGEITTSPGPNGNRPPPVPELPRFEVYTSYHQGNVYILIRTSGDRPESQNAGVIGYEEDLPWKSFHAYKFNTIEKTSESIEINQLPFYMIPLGERGENYGDIVRGLRSDPAFSQDTVDIRDTYTTSRMALQAYYIEVTSGEYWGVGNGAWGFSNYSVSENPIVDKLIDPRVKVFGWGTQISGNVLDNALAEEPTPTAYQIFPIELFNTSEEDSFKFDGEEDSFNDTGWIPFTPQVEVNGEEFSYLPLREGVRQSANIIIYKRHPDTDNLITKTTLPSDDPNRLDLKLWGSFVNLTDNTLKVCHNFENIKVGFYRDGSGANYDPEFLP